MTKNPTYLTLIIMLCGLLCSFSGCNPHCTDDCDQALLYNQVGYPTHGAKKALVRTPSKWFKVHDQKGSLVKEGRPEDFKYWALSGDSVRVIDFSEINQPGRYTIQLEGVKVFFDIEVADRPLTDLVKAGLKAFYFNRTATTIGAEEGGMWARESGHPDTSVQIHSSAADELRPEGTIISSPGGWYDAGDYNKYIVNSSISVYTLLMAYQLNKGYADTFVADIPESSNGHPDILDEALFNLRWMMTMQDPNDGGVYHKLTTKRFEDFVMPVKATQQRYVVQKSTAAALDFAATMACASRVLAGHSESFEGLSETCMVQAMRAWQWALDNPAVLYQQPEDIHTGAYDDKVLVDEFFWAASELYLTTGDLGFLKALNTAYTISGVPSWSNVGTLGVISLLNSDKAEQFSSYKTDFIQQVDKLLVLEHSTPYLVSVDTLPWGSNAEVANRAMLKQVAFMFTSNSKYMESAQNDINYILGRNATGYCFVSGFGKVSPVNIHHRPSAADGIPQPVPGFLIGGPNVVVLSDCGPEVTRSSFPAKSYVDAECSYSTNEVAINWNAPLVFITSILDAYDMKMKK